MGSALARIAFVSDAAGGQGGTTARVAAAISAAFARFHRPSQTWLVIGGDEYSPSANSHTVKHYDEFLDQPHISAARTVMTPGNHSNGPGGAYPDANAWLAYNRARGTLTRTSGGWINRAKGIPLTDQSLDIAGVRFILVNSGGVLDLSETPGWPVPRSGGSVLGDPRVRWLRDQWSGGTANVVVTHHPRWSYFGDHHDNPTMQNLIDEIRGHNDGSGGHAQLILQGHDHNMQVMKPQYATGSFPGLTSAVVGLCATAPAVHTGPRGQTSQRSWLRFANMSPGGCGFMQIDITSDRTLGLSMIDARDTSGRLMQNTPASGATGSATQGIELT
jgi:hypothetical protein